jgi:hypothetical protein
LRSSIFISRDLKCCHLAIAVSPSLNLPSNIECRFVVDRGRERCLQGVCVAGNEIDRHPEVVLHAQMNIHFIHSFRVSSCASFLICSVYLVLNFLSNPYQAVLQRSKKSFELLFCLCCKAAINLNFCVSLTTLSKRSSKSGCSSFQLAADAGFSSWRRRAQLGACSRSASMTMIAVLSLPCFWTVSRRETCRHHVLRSQVSLSLPRKFSSFGFDTSILALSSLVAILFLYFCFFFVAFHLIYSNHTYCVD